MAYVQRLSKFWRELLLGVFAAVMAVSFAQEKPNVVILFADDVSWEQALLLLNDNGKG